MLSYAEPLLRESCWSKLRYKRQGRVLQALVLLHSNVERLYALIIKHILSYIEDGNIFMTGEEFGNESQTFASKFISAQVNAM